MNVDFAKVCSKHIGVYEAYYKQVCATPPAPAQRGGFRWVSTHPRPTPY